MNLRKRLRLLNSILMVIGIFTLLAGENVSLAARSAEAKCPDLTKGDNIPEGWTHDWTLGPTGMRGWIYCDRHTTTDSRQIKVTKVEKGSPADGVMNVGDVILGVYGRDFNDDARISFGKAITEAEKTENEGKLPLLVWRDGKTSHVVIQLEPMGSYSPTAPFDCPKSKKILEQGCAALAKKMKADPTGEPHISRALNALLLLSSGNPEYLPVVKEQAKLLSQYDANSTWNCGFVNIFLAEYVLATGDRSYVDQGLTSITKLAVDGQGLVGSYGHKFADLKTKRLSGYGMMNTPGLLLTYSMVLAQRAGVKVDGLEKAIDKSTTFLKFYVGKGAIPYGDHNPWIETHDDNGKCGLASVLFDHQGNAAATEFYSRMSVADHGPRRDEGHTGNFFNITWALPGVVRSGPNASGAWIAEFGWYYDLARRWDGTFLYQGAPEPRPQVYDNWESTGSYLLGFTYPLKKTYLTGRKPSVAPAVDRTTAASLIDDGRGWTSKDRTSYYDKMTTAQLLKRLSSWSPTVRDRTAAALGRKREDITSELIDLLDAPDLYTKYGACQAIKMQRGRGAAAVPALLKTFDSDDLWLRILAAEALAGIGEPARVAVPEMLKRFVRTDPVNDPRNMEQRYLSFALFNKGDGLLGRSLEGVDHKLLFEAVRQGLKNEDGRARGSLASVYENLTFDELKPLLPDIYQAIKEMAPSDIMFSAEIRMAGLKLFSDNHVSEGIELCAYYARHQRPHASEQRIGRIMEMLKTYGAHGKRVLDELEAVAYYFENDEEDFPKRLSLDKAKAVRDTIEYIKASTDKPKLIYLGNKSAGLTADLKGVEVKDLGDLKLPPVAKTGWMFKGFPIMAWWPPPGTKTLQDFQRYREAGFTIYAANPDAGFDNALKLARKAGIPVMGHRTMGGFDVPAPTKPVVFPEDDSNVVGWLTRDEPGGYSAVSRAIGEVNELMRLDPARWALFNNFPLNRRQTPSVLEIAEAALRNGMPVLSYDNYVIMEDGTDKTKEHFDNLAIARELSLKYDVPFWAFALTTKHRKYRRPSESDIRFKQFTNLAYGAKGLWYFCYWGPHRWDDKGWDTKSIVDSATGEPTDLYYHVKMLNENVLAMGDILLGLTSEDVVHTHPPQGHTAFEKNKRWIADIKAKDALIGFFRNAVGGLYALVVNKLHGKSKSSKEMIDTIDLTFAADVKAVEAVSWLDGTPGKLILDGQKTSLRIGGGTGVLIKLR